MHLMSTPGLSSNAHNTYEISKDNHTTWPNHLTALRVCQRQRNNFLIPFHHLGGYLVEQLDVVVTNFALQLGKLLELLLRLRTGSMRGKDRDSIALTLTTSFC